MQIVCKLKREGGSKVTLGKNEYHFKPNAEGDHVCDVADKRDIDKLLSISEAYHELGQQEAVAVEPEEVTEAVDPEKMDNKALNAWAKEVGINPKNKQSIADYAQDNYEVELEFDKNVSCSDLIREVVKIDLEEAAED